MENEEKIRLEARRRLEEQLKQYRVQRQKERVGACKGKMSGGGGAVLLDFQPMSTKLYHNIYMIMSEKQSLNVILGEVERCTSSVSLVSAD